METELQLLMTRIEEECSLLNRLLALVQQKKEAIIKGDTALMADLVVKIDEGVHELEEMGFNRQDHVLRICRSHALRPTESLRDFLRQLPKETKTQLEPARDLLLKLYQELSQQTLINGELLGQSIRYSQNMFDRFASIDRSRHGSTATYTPKGLQKKSHGQSPLLRAKG